MEKYTQIIEEFKILSKKNKDFLMEEIEELLEDIEEEEFKIAIVGEFSAGKSTFINALLGKRILFSDTSEATKVVTEIISSNEKKGSILYTDGTEEVIDLKSNNAYENLKRYFLNREEKNIEKIVIKYPNLLGENIVLLDTPGLKGMDKAVVQRTRKGIKEANMVLYMTNIKGFQGTELEIIKNEIKTENVVFIANKIGEIYGKYRKKEADLKIEELSSDIKNIVISNNIKNLNLFKIDSRDYLWSKDKELYEEVIKLYKGKGILSQEEYEIRSNFQSIIEYFKEIFKREHYKMLKERDIKEKFELILTEFKSYTKSDIKKEKIDELEIIKKQKEMILENRKAINNKIKRSIRESHMIIKDDCLIASKNKMKEIDGELIEFINGNITDVKNINSETVKISIWLKNNVDTKFKEVLEGYRKQVGYLTNIINDVFEETKKVKLVFKNNIPLNLRLENNLIEINIEYKADEAKDEIMELQEVIKNLEIKIKECESKYKEDYNFKLYEINKKIMEYENELERVLEKLELDKPTPKKIYKTVYKGWFIFERKEKVFDRFDYSNLNEWAKNKNKKIDEYLKKINNLEKISSNIKEDIFKQKMNKDDVERYRIELNEVKKEKLDLEKEYKQEVKENKKRFIDGKKDEILKILDERKKRYFYEFEENFKKIMEEEEKRYRKEVEKSTSEYFKVIESLLREKEKEFEKIYDKKNSLSDYIINSLENIENLMRRI